MVTCIPATSKFRVEIAFGASSTSSSSSTPQSEQATMPRRGSRKTEDTVLDVRTTEIEVIVASTPKKGRKVVKVEATETITEVAKSPANSSKKRVKKEEHSDEDNTETPKKPAGPKINKVKSKAVLEEEANSKLKKTPAKRKVKAEDDEDEEADKGKAKKKRKTKEEKEAEAMPLAARTVISTLKKSMHIGAHVSGAGGIYDYMLRLRS